MGITRSASHVARKSPYRWTACAILLVFSAVFTARAIRAQGDDAGQIYWTQVPDGQLRLDGKTPLTWNVYQPGKKDKKKGSNLILVLLGHRYLMLDTKARLVYEVRPTDLQAQGQDFQSGDLARPDHLIPSTDWSDRDVGAAELFRLTLEDYGRVLDVELPHPLFPDIRLGIY
ncbi:MAG: hypothetical protein WA405_08790 [Candidatus Acidiferrales bacterium]